MKKSLFKNYFSILGRTAIALALRLFVILVSGISKEEVEKYVVTNLVLKFDKIKYKSNE